MVVGAAKIFSIIDWAGLALSDALALILVFSSSISSDFVISRYLLFIRSCSTMRTNLAVTSRGPSFHR